MVTWQNACNDNEYDSKEEILAVLIENGHEIMGVRDAGQKDELLMVLGPEERPNTFLCEITFRKKTGLIRFERYKSPESLDRDEVYSLMEQLETGKNMDSVRDIWTLQKPSEGHKNVVKALIAFPVLLIIIILIAHLLTR